MEEKEGAEEQRAKEIAARKATRVKKQPVDSGVQPTSSGSREERGEGKLVDSAHSGGPGFQHIGAAISRQSLLAGP